MSRGVRIIGIVVIAVVLIVAAVFFWFRSIDTPDIFVRGGPLENLSDGIYEGFYDGGLVQAEVTVRVNGGNVDEIRIVKHNTLLGKKAESIVEEIIANQTLEVDIVSGATLSSNVIRKAVEVALTN